MKRFASFLLLLAATYTPIFSQDQAPLVEGYYTVGDQTFSITAGANIPLFFTSFDGDFEPASGHLKAGGQGTLEWGAYLNNNLNLGGSIGISFLNTINDRTLYLIPVMGTASWFFHADRFDFPVYAGLGAAITRLDEDSAITPIYQLGGGAFFNYNKDWSFGLKVGYLGNMEVYFGGLSGDSQIAHYLQAGLTALYHF